MNLLIRCIGIKLKIRDKYIMAPALRAKKSPALRRAKGCILKLFYFIKLCVNSNHYILGNHQTAGFSGPIPF